MENLVASASPETDREIFDGVFTLAQFSAFMVPGGAILAGAVSVFQTIFDQTIWGKQGLPLATVISNAIADEVKRDNLETASETIIVLYKWFKGNYETEWQDDDHIDPEELTRFKTTLFAALDGLSPFQISLQKMQEKRYREAGFTIFMFGAALRLALMKVAAILLSHNKGFENTHEWKHMQSVLQEYIDYATETKTLIDARINARLGKVGPIKEVGGYVYKAFTYTDDGTSTDPKNPIHLSFGPYKDAVKAQISRDAYLEELRANLNLAKFLSLRPDKIDAVIGKWKEGIVNLDPLLHGKQ
jgi:hypothetical protein